jgi:hypothetical protein
MAFRCARSGVMMRFRPAKLGFAFSAPLAASMPCSCPARTGTGAWISGRAPDRDRKDGHETAYDYAMSRLLKFRNRRAQLCKTRALQRGLQAASNCEALDAGNKRRRN